MSANDHYAGDTALKGDYDRNVFGIGRESDGSLSATPFVDGLSLTALNSSLDVGDYLLAGNKVETNSFTSADLPAGTGGRWSRVWYLDKTNSVDARLTFDFSEGGLAFPTGATFRLLYSPTNSFAFADLGLNPTVLGDQISFDLLNANLLNGYYTLEEVPEPSLILLLGLGGLISWRRRHG